MQESGEMYLETILILSQQLETIHAVDVCTYMNFSKPSVSRALNILKEEEYITIDDESHIHLTKKGKKLAEKVYETHKLLTELLISLGVSEKTASGDSCKMEHDISDESIKAIKKYMGKK